MSTRSAALDSLTGLRWWAAFGVFLFHMTAFAPVPIFPIFEFGNYGVMFFFVLSGFVLTWSWKPELPVRAFYLRRIGRIWPAAMVALVFAIPVFYSFNPDPAQWWVKPVDVGVLLLSVPLIQGWWLAPVILFSGNPAAWTLTCEFFFYSLHPVVQRIFIRLSGLFVVLLLIAVILLPIAVKSFCTFGSTGECSPLPLPVERLPEFVLGMGIGILAKRGKTLKFSPWIPIGLLGLFFLFQTTAPMLGFPPTTFIIPTTFANEITLILMVLIIATVAQSDIAGEKSRFSSKWLVKLGEVSFTFYLVHATVMYLFIDVFGQLAVSWSNLLWYPTVLLAGLVLAFGLHLWIEKPFEKRIRSFSNRFKPRVIAHN